MKTITLRLAVFFLILTTFSSCEVIGDIFQAGIGVGIFIVIAIIAVVVFIISRFRK